MDPDFFDFKKKYKSGQEFLSLSDDNAIAFVKSAKVVSLPKTVLKALHHTKDPHSRLSIVLSLSNIYRIHPLVFLFHYNQLCGNISVDSLEKLLLVLCRNMWYENAAFIMSHSNLSISETLKAVCVVVQYIIDDLNDGPLGVPDFLRFLLRFCPNGAFQKQIIKQILTQLKKIYPIDDYMDPCSSFLQDLIYTRSIPLHHRESELCPGTLARKIHFLERKKAYDEIPSVVEKADLGMINIFDIEAILSYSKISSAYELWCKWKKFDSVFIHYFIRANALGFVNSCFAETCSGLEPQTIAAVLNENLFEKPKNSSFAPSQPLLTLQKNLSLLEEEKLSSACVSWSVLIRDTDPNQTIGLRRMSLLLSALDASCMKTIPGSFFESLGSKVLSERTDLRTLTSTQLLVWLKDFWSIENLKVEDKVTFSLRLLKLANKTQIYHALPLVLAKLHEIPLQKNLNPLITQALSCLDHSQQCEMLCGLASHLDEATRPILNFIIKQVFKDKIAHKMDTKNPLKISEEFDSVYHLLLSIDAEGYERLTGPSKRYLVKSLSFFNPHLGKAFVEQFQHDAVPLEILEGFLLGIMKSRKTNISSRGKFRIFERTLRNKFYKQNLNMRSPIIELIEHLLRTANESGTIPKQRLQWALHLARSNNVDLQKYPQWAELLKVMAENKV